MGSYYIHTYGAWKKKIKPQYAPLLFLPKNAPKKDSLDDKAIFVLTITNHIVKKGKNG